MTSVNYSKELNRMEIKGHAGAGELGNDIVCAALSTLAQLLVRAAYQHMEFLPEIYINPNETVIRVECKPPEELKDKCTEMFELIAEGFRMIRDEYPDYVKIGA